ncbi:Plant calmodulin-binding domain-containing protein [Carex littledalei]|uniref:Plant calmodulin-binding domain-containing protein n=1 Tax=Carex littledalei TaxID=544730 RepID=A0A833V7E6_9POAL|nr:Plant calmodulin-binding domain-containing protein [Carex littledalei]
MQATIMSYTPRKSTSHTTAPPSPRRPCTPESNHGRSPRAPGPPGSPDRRAISSEKPTKSYLRPTVSSIMHHGSSNTSQPRRSVDKPPFLPPSSVGVHSQHHKNLSSSSRGSLSLKGILTRATNAMKIGTDRNRRSSASAGLNIGKGSGTSTPVRPRSPAPLPKKKEGSRNFARSNSVPKKLGVLNKDKERDTMSISSIEDNLPEHLPDPVKITPHAPENVFQSIAPHVNLQEPSYTEKIEDHVHEQVIESFIVATDHGNPIEENHKVVMLEEINESPKEVDSVKVIEECREEQPKMEEEVEETPKETENVVIIGEKQEEEAPEFEAMNVVEELPQETHNVAIIEEHIEEQPEEAIIELPKGPEETVVVNDEVETIAEEDIEKPEESEEKEITITENHEAPKEEVVTQDKVEEEKPEVEPETKVEETPKAEECGTVVEETPKAEENSTIEEMPKVEEKPIATETEEKKEEVITVTPKVEEKLVSTIVAEPKKEKTTFKRPDAVSTRREGAVSNDVIEETKSKLMEKRKNKVLALVGAFETVMHKPEEGNTRR